MLFTAKRSLGAGVHGPWSLSFSGGAWVSTSGVCSAARAESCGARGSRSGVTRGNELVVRG